MLASYALLTFVLTLPIGLRLSTEVPGGGDAWQHIWNLWWVKQALLVEHTNPYHTNLLFYPDGANLYFHTLVLTAGLIGIPLQLAGLNLIATYNVILLMTFVLAGYGTFLLCRYLARAVWPSFVGGIVFAFCPYHFAHLFGHMNLVSLQWIPFYALSLFKAADTPSGGVPGRWKSLLPAMATGALLALNAYTDWLYAIFLAIFTGLFLGWRLLVPSERRQFVADLGWREGALRLFVGAGVAFLLVSPVLFPTLEEARKGYAQQAPLETLVYSSDAMLAFIPSELHPLWGHSIAIWVNTLGPYLPIKNTSERVVSAGYAVLFLAVVGSLILWRERKVRFWAFAAFATWLLSLGPILQWLGKTQFTLFGVTVPLPYLLLYRLPLFSIMRTPARLAVLTMLCLAVLVAYALARLLRSTSMPRTHTFLRVGLSRYSGMALLFPAIIIFEFWSVPFPTVPPGWNIPIYAKIASEPGNFALLELPLRPFGDYMAYQTVHGKPIIGGYLSRQPPYPLLDQSPAVHYLLDTTSPDDPAKASVSDGAGVTELRHLNVKYIIIRWWAFTAEKRTEMQSKLHSLVPRSPDFSYPADQVDVWQLSP